MKYFNKFYYLIYFTNYLNIKGYSLIEFLVLPAKA